MNSFRLALTFLSIPRLFLTLIFWPLFLGIVFATLQVSFSSFYISATERSPEQYRKDLLNDSMSNAFVLQTVLPDQVIPATPRMCLRPSAGIVGTIPRSAETDCTIADYDLVIRTNSFSEPSISYWSRIFSGIVAQIHICSDCSSHLTIDTTTTPTSTLLQDYKALVLFSTAKQASNYQARIESLNAKQLIDDFKLYAGNVIFTPANQNGQIPLSNVNTLIVLLFNTATIILTTLWLLLRSHRKVLDYFAKNGALLPLVAACGKQSFYQSLWVITITRVLAFLLSCVPTTILVYRSIVDETSLNSFIFNDGGLFILWLMAVSLGMGTLTIIASIADLKERHSTLSPWFRLTPLIACILGLVLWGYSLLFSAPWLYCAQRIIVATPVLGILPIMFAPLVSTNEWLLFVHIWLSTIITLALLKINARWFAAHLEEL